MGQMRRVFDQYSAHKSFFMYSVFTRLVAFSLVLLVFLLASQQGGVMPPFAAITTVMISALLLFEVFLPGHSQPKSIISVLLFLTCFLTPIAIFQMHDKSSDKKSEYALVIPAALLWIAWIIITLYLMSRQNGALKLGSL